VIHFGSWLRAGRVRPRVRYTDHAARSVSERRLSERRQGSGVLAHRGPAPSRETSHAALFHFRGIIVRGQSFVTLIITTPFA
jgi:hypothetical protein